jgi:hypothetical protein
MSNEKPTLIAYSIREREGKKAIWTRIGAAFDARFCLAGRPEKRKYLRQIVSHQGKSQTDVTCF